MTMAAVDIEPAVIESIKTGIMDQVKSELTDPIKKEVQTVSEAVSSIAGILTSLQQAQVGLTDNLSALTSQISQMNNRPRRNGGQRRCFICQSTEHMVAQCPLNKNNEKSESKAGGPFEPVACAACIPTPVLSKALPSLDTNMDTPPQVKHNEEAKSRELPRDQRGASGGPRGWQKGCGRASLWLLPFAFLVLLARSQVPLVGGRDLVGTALASTKFLSLHSSSFSLPWLSRLPMRSSNIGEERARKAETLGSMMPMNKTHPWSEASAPMMTNKPPNHWWVPWNWTWSWNGLETAEAEKPMTPMGQTPQVCPLRPPWVNPRSEADRPRMTFSQTNSLGLLS